MGFSLYQAVVPTYLQILNSTIGLVDKVEEHCKTQGIDPSELLNARLAEDMWPFANQVYSVKHHSLGAIEGAKAGLFAPPVSELVPTDFAGLRQVLSDAHSGIQAFSEEEINALPGKHMRFEIGSFKMEFIAEDFLLSFSQPNFYFHATTSYAIMRHLGISIGKLDYLGQFRKLS